MWNSFSLNKREKGVYQNLYSYSEVYFNRTIVIFNIYFLHLILRTHTIFLIFMVEYNY